MSRRTYEFSGNRGSIPANNLGERGTICEEAEERVAEAIWIDGGQRRSWALAKPSERPGYTEAAHQQYLRMISLAGLDVVLHKPDAQRVSEAIGQIERLAEVIGNAYVAGRLSSDALPVVGALNRLAEAWAAAETELDELFTPPTLGL